jgi:F0F1-type ATP synthase assembly protein I
MMIFITLLGIVASVNAIRAINQDLTTTKTEARQSNEHKIP